MNKYSELYYVAVQEFWSVKHKTMPSLH